VRSHERCGDTADSIAVVRPARVRLDSGIGSSGKLTQPTGAARDSGTVPDGLVIRVEIFKAEAQALQGAGLSENARTSS
jgi:hypothetical protein